MGKNWGRINAATYSVITLIPKAWIDNVTVNGAECEAETDSRVVVVTGFQFPPAQQH